MELESFIIDLISAILSILLPYVLLFCFVMVVVTIIRKNAARSNPGQGSQTRTRPRASQSQPKRHAVEKSSEVSFKLGKLPNMTNGASVWLHKRARELEEEDEAHAYIIGTEKYSTQDPTFSFEGRFVVDEFAQLRKKNAAHERHLTERLK